jgi:hypothetical protein
MPLLALDTPLSLKLRLVQKDRESSFARLKRHPRRRLVNLPQKENECAINLLMSC